MQHFLVNQEKKHCNTCAYSESGHVVFAYLNGYRCLEMQLMELDDEDGYFSYALLDYGKDTNSALDFIGEKMDAKQFQNLSLAERLKAIDIGHRLMKISLGGSVANAVYRNDGDAHIPLPIQIEFTDLRKAEFIQSILKDLTVNHDIDFLENELASALYTIDNAVVWHSIHELAKALLKEKYLNQNDIEECLAKTMLLPLFD